MEEDRIYYENTVRHEIYQDGLKEGREQEQLKIAKKMKDKGQSINFTQEITGLSMEEIKKL